MVWDSITGIILRGCSASEQESDKSRKQGRVNRFGKYKLKFGHKCLRESFLENCLQALV